MLANEQLSIAYLIFPPLCFKLQYLSRSEKKRKWRLKEDMGTFVAVWWWIWVTGYSYNASLQILLVPSTRLRWCEQQYVHWCTIHCLTVAAGLSSAEDGKPWPWRVYRVAACVCSFRYLNWVLRSYSQSYPQPSRREEMIDAFNSVIAVTTTSVTS